MKQLSISFLLTQASSVSSEGNVFEGGCCDTGATQSVIGKQQAYAYCRLVGNKIIIWPNSHRVYFTFGEQRVSNIGRTSIVIPHSDDESIKLQIHVVDLPIPFLMKLDLLDKPGLYVNSFRNFLVCENDSWSLPLVRKYGHIYLKWGKYNPLPDI